MKLTYYTGHPNFGDMLNPLLARHVFGQKFDRLFDDDANHRLLFIGTIIERKAPAGCHETILGAGAGYHAGRYSLERRNVLCVRGPLTCDILGIDRGYAAIDPAILTSRYYKAGSPTSAGVLFMPHHSTHARAEAPLRGACANAGMDYVSPFDDAGAIIRKIAAARRVVTEALHGAVVAESFGVPCLPVVFGAKVLDVKWRDYAASIGADYRPAEIHTNIAFDGKVSFADRVKYAAFKVGFGKDKYKYLPVRKAAPSALSVLEGKLRALATGDAGLMRATAVKSASIARLDAAIEAFAS